MGWTMLYLFVFLKIPILLLFWLVWWAVHQDTEADEGQGGDGGSRLERKPRPHPYEPLPRLPRRGPHGDPLPLPPPRVRPVHARAREYDR
jgi:hypothetical protein